MRDDKRLIEDYLPIVAIGAEASRETIRVGSVLNEDRGPISPVGVRRGEWSVELYLPPFGQDPNGRKSLVGGTGSRPERSDHPQLFRAPADRHQTSDDWRFIARVGHEAGDLIVPPR